MAQFRPPLIIEQTMSDSELQCHDELQQWRQAICADTNRFALQLPETTFWSSSLSSRSEKLLYLVGIFVFMLLKTIISRIFDSRKTKGIWQTVLWTVFKSKNLFLDVNIVLIAMSGVCESAYAVIAILLGILLGNIFSHFIKIIKLKLAFCRTKIKGECDKTEKNRGVLNPTFQHFSVIDRSADIIRVQNKDADDVYLQPRPRPAQKMSECDSTEGYITVANPHNRAAVRAEVYDESDYYSIAVNKEQVYDSPYDQSQN